MSYLQHFYSQFYSQDQFLTAVKHNDFKTIERLLAKHSDVIVCRQAAEEAAQHAHVECLKLLLPHCGKWNFDYFITTAAVRGQSEVVEALVSHYPPDMVDVQRLEHAYKEAKVCENSMLLLLPYLSEPEKFSFMLHVGAPMSSSFVKQFVNGMDPLRGGSVMLAWAAIYNDARFDVLYPISDPAQALVKLHQISAVKPISSMQQAIERLQARMQKDVLEVHTHSGCAVGAKRKI